jgi:hypothetical protein
VKRAPGRTGVKKDLEEIVQTCNSIGNRQFSPFLLDVPEALRILRLHAGDLNRLEDHLLDMRALTGIARVVGLQSSQLRFQSTSLFLDPEMAKEKLEGLSRQQLAEFFLLSWHPVTELEQLVMPAIKEASEYWKNMLSFFERRGKFDLGPFAPPEAFGLGDLTGSGLMEDQTFTERLQGLWNELKSRAKEGEKVEYWSFVRTKDFRETVSRAQLVSFLVSYGYANMDKRGDRILLTPNETPVPQREGSPHSFPIPIPWERAA